MKYTVALTIICATASASASAGGSGRHIRHKRQQNVQSQPGFPTQQTNFQGQQTDFPTDQTGFQNQQTVFPTGQTGFQGQQPAQSDSQSIPSTVFDQLQSLLGITFANQPTASTPRLASSTIPVPAATGTAPAATTKQSDFVVGTDPESADIHRTSSTSGARAAATLALAAVVAVAIAAL